MPNKIAAHKDPRVISDIANFYVESDIRRIMRLFPPLSFNFAFGTYAHYLSWVMEHVEKMELEDKTIEERYEFLSRTLNQPQFDRAFSIVMMSAPQ